MARGKFDKQKTQIIFTMVIKYNQCSVVQYTRNQTVIYTIQVN